jgi:hypothetical protein
MTIKIKSTQGPIRISVPAGAAPVYLGGQPGPHGLSAYDLAVLEGFGGTRADWISLISGEEPLSDQSGNRIERLADGLYVPPPQLASAQW